MASTPASAASDPARTGPAAAGSAVVGSQLPLPPRSVIVAGSVATDHLMRFPGRFAEQLLPEALDRLSVSFLVDDLVIRRGGVAGNIAYGLGLFAVAPLLVAAVGEDFTSYGNWLTDHGVDISGVEVIPGAHTARFVCTTDADQCQIASFYPGAMSHARDIDLGAAFDRHGDPWLVVVSPDDPAAMRRHTEVCRRRGVSFLADPSQQLASLDGPAVRNLVDGALLLVGNAYERELLESRTGWTAEQVLSHVGVRITTRGAEGVVIEGAGQPAATVAAVPARTLADPTGVGDAFRAGLLAARRAGRDLLAAARLGCLVATWALETVGTQEYQLDVADGVARLREAYGAPAAADLEPLLAGAPLPVAGVW